jgi:hypothetical protein
VSTANVGQGTQKSQGLLQLSVFLQITKQSKLQQRAVAANNFRESHIRGAALLLFTPVVLLDILSSALAGLHLFLPFIFTFCSPLWRTAATSHGLLKLGRLPLTATLPWRSLERMIRYLQLIGGPLFCAWAVLVAAVPLLCQVLIHCTEDSHCSLLRSDASGVWHGFGPRLRSASEALLGLDVSPIRVGRLLLVLSCWLVWLVVVVASLVQARQAVKRFLPLFSPFKAVRSVSKAIVKIWQPYKGVFIKLTIWSFAHRESGSWMVGELLIPFVLCLWVGWPLGAVLLLILSHRTDDTTHWNTAEIIGVSATAAIALLLIFRSLRVFAKYWTPPLSPTELVRLRTPALELLSLRAEAPGGVQTGTGIVLHVEAKVPGPVLQAKIRKVRLQVDGDEFWARLRDVVGVKARVILPALRRTVLPLDLVEHRCWDPVKAFENHVVGDTLQTRMHFGVAAQSTHVKSRTVRKFVAKLAVAASPGGGKVDPTALLRVEYKDGKQWRTLLAHSVRPSELLEALDSGGESGGAGWLALTPTRASATPGQLPPALALADIDLVPEPELGPHPMRERQCASPEPEVELEPETGGLHDGSKVGRSLTPKPLHVDARP